MAIFEALMFEILFFLKNLKKKRFLKKIYYHHQQSGKKEKKEKKIVHNKILVFRVGKFLALLLNANEA